MAVVNDELDEKRRAKRASRLRWLVAVQLVLATAYAWTPLVLPLLSWRGRGYLNWAAGGVAQAPMILLAFWCALGTSSRVRRRIGAMLGIAYLATASMLHGFVYESTLPSLFSDARRYSSAYGERFISVAGVNALFVCIFAGGLLLARRWIGELQYFDEPDDDVPTRRAQYQFSIGHLVAATTLTAIVCGLSRGAAYKWPAGTRFDWQGWSQQGLFVIAFLIFMLVAARATLSPGPTRGRVWRAALICVLVSWAYTLAMPNGDLSWWLKSWWWLLLNSLALMGLPAGIMIASLLVVRSCGYRLTI